MVLVTGGTGLVGSTIIHQLLEDQQQVKVLTHRKSLELSHPLLTQVKGDLLDVDSLEQAMESVTKIYHCAAMVSFDPADDVALFKVNVEGTANLVNIALDMGIEKLVHVSSVAALGRIREGEMISEKMQWTPATSNSRYGQSKYLGEMEVWRAAAEGLNVNVVNPVIILGNGDWNDGSTKIFQSVYNEFKYYSEGVTGFVDVRDLVKSMILLMESEISGERFIISAENTDYRTVFNMIADSFGKKRPSVNINPLIASFAWRSEKIKSFFSSSKPLVTKETASTALAKSYFDNSKFLSAFPSFSYKPLRQTIDETCSLLQQKINSI